MSTDPAKLMRKDISKRRTPDGYSNLGLIENTGKKVLLPTSLHLEVEVPSELMDLLKLPYEKSHRLTTILLV